MQVCRYINTKTDISNIDKYNYISTENMLQDKAGVSIASTIPIEKSVSSYKYNDILISNIRPYFKKIWLATKNGGCSNDVLVIRANKDTGANFLYYVLSDNNFFNYANVTSKGTKMPRGSKTAIMKYLIPDILLLAQQKIADVLSAYDDLIENNNRRIELLEKASQNLYKEWFVRFRFPNYKNSRFENGLPQGWEFVKLKDYYKTTSGGTPSRKNENYYINGKYNWIKTGELNDRFIISTDEKITEEAIKWSSAKLIDINSLIMAMYGATIGKLGFTIEESTCNQACCVFNPKYIDLSNEYLYFWLKTNREYIINISFGAAQQNLSQELINNLKILKPDNYIVELFDKLIKPIFEEIKILQTQINNLIKQRDLLLPRLMSGKLEV